MLDSVNILFVLALRFRWVPVVLFDSCGILLFLAWRTMLVSKDNAQETQHLGCNSENGADKYLQGYAWLVTRFCKGFLRGSSVHWLALGNQIFALDLWIEDYRNH